MRKKIISILLLAIVLSSCTQEKISKEDDVVDIVWYVLGSEQKDEKIVEDEINKRLEKEIGVRLDLRMIDANEYAEKMRFNFSSNNEFDLCYVGYINRYEELVPKNLLYPMNDFLDDSELKNEIPDYIWEDVKINGEIYAVPNMQTLITQRNVFVRSDLAKKYNLDLDRVEKTEDLIPFLDAVRDNEPDVYPFDTNSDLTTFVSNEDYQICDIFSNISVLDCFDGTLKIVPIYASKTKETAEKLHSWYEKGYIRKDILSVSNEDYDRQKSKYAVFVNNYKPGGVDETNASKDIAYIEKIIQEKPTIVAGSEKMTMTGINAKSKHPKEAFKVIELMNTDKELYNLAVFGVEGVHYDKVSDNRISLKPNSGYLVRSWALGCQFNAYYVGDQNEEDWKKTIQLNDTAAKSKLFGFNFDISDVEKKVDEVRRVSAKYKKLTQSAAISTDEYWDEYMSNLLEAGYDDVYAELKKQLREFLLKKYPDMWSEVKNSSTIFHLED